MRIILASGSPRRREILTMLGLDFEVVVSDVDEESGEKDPARLVCELSRRKGIAVRDSLGDAEDTLIISSDTLVWCEGEVLGKPRDEADARRMIKLMSGKTHSVYSGICVCLGGKCVARASETRVTFAPMTDGQIETYIKNCEYADKAGAYAIQEGASLFIEGIEGDYFTVVGLPVRELCCLLGEEFSVDMQALCAKK